MQLTQVLLLACSTLALAKPYHHWHSGEHHYYKTGCPSASAAGNSSLAALPSSMEPTATAGGPPAGGAPTDTSFPSEGGLSSTVAAVYTPPAEPTSAAVVASPVETATSSAAAAPVQSSAAPVSGGTTYTATFTQYGAGDDNGSGNCNTATAACGWYSNPGYNAAASQNLFGVGPGAGAGPACGLCFQLTAKTNPYSNNAALTGANSIVVKVNNLCPSDGNALCSQSSLTSTNSLGGEVNFDLCKDDGAAAALFGSSGVGAALGTATQVSCDSWTGSSNLTS